MKTPESSLIVLIAVCAVVAAGILQLGKMMRKSGRRDHWSNSWVTHLVCSTILIACMFGIEYLWS